MKTGVKSVGHSGWRLAQARQVHRDVCSLLSSAADWLQNTIRRFSSLLPNADEEAVANKDSSSETDQHQARMAILEQVIINRISLIWFRNFPFGRLI